MRFSTTFLASFFFLVSAFWSCNEKHTSGEINKLSPDTLSKSSNIDPTLSDSARLVLIENLMGEARYETALKNINFLLDKTPDNPGFLYIKADALENLKDTNQAILHFKKAEKSAGKFLQARIRLLKLMAETGNPRTLPLSDSLLSDPETEKMRSDIWLMKGIYFTQKGKAKEAEQVFNEIIKNDYTFLQAYLEKGLLYYDQGLFKKALGVFELSTIVKNDFADGYFWMGKTFLKEKRKEEAILHFKKSLALDPNLTEARDELKNLGVIQ